MTLWKLVSKSAFVGAAVAGESGTLLVCGVVTFASGFSCCCCLLLLLLLLPRSLSAVNRDSSKNFPSNLNMTLFSRSREVTAANAARAAAAAAAGWVAAAAAAGSTAAARADRSGVTTTRRAASVAAAAAAAAAAEGAEAAAASGSLSARAETTGREFP
jgi:hypothetical protein